MLDSLTKDNWRDFSQRYRGTYGWYTPEIGKPRAVYITNVSEEMVQFQGLDGNEYHALADKGVKFRFLPFRKKIFVGQDGAAYVAVRRPARQWRRGICNDNTLVYMLRPDGARAVPIATAVKQLMSEEGSKLNKGVKLSDNFAIVGTIVYLHEHMIGGIVGNHITVLNEYRLFKQELRDALRDNSLSYIVE